MNPLYHLHQQQAHIEQLALTAHQILQEASDILQFHVGDKPGTISRLYQLQMAVDAHQFADAQYSNTLLNGLDQLVHDVASVDGVVENRDSFWDPDVNDLLQHELEQQQQTIRESIHVVHTGAVGPPTLHIPEQLLQNLIDAGYSAQEIADLADIPKMTIYRKAKLYGLEFNPGSTLSVEEIDHYVSLVKKDYPRWGRKMVRAAVKLRYGVVISERKISASLRRVDPIGAVTRWAVKLYRRKYNVPGPHYLWHMDCNHKLLEWDFVFYGMIDGYSRKCLCLKVNDHQRAATWLKYFKEAMAIHGNIPQRVRGDNAINKGVIKEVDNNGYTVEKK